MRIKGNMKVYVGAVQQETETIKRFKLYPVDGKLLPPFSGGSHITTVIQNGEDVLERQYSLVSSPAERSYYEIAIRRDDNSRGGSVYWHDNVKEGDHLEISFPRNHFPLSYRAKHHVFYAAGIGITPFMTMMADLKAEGKSFELHYAARNEELCAFYDEIQEKYEDHCTFYFSQGTEPKRMTPEIMLNHPIGTHVYFCGPTNMVQEFKQAAELCGYPKASIHFELFAAVDAGPRNAFKVVLKNSNRVIDVPAEETLLDTLLKNGIDAPHSCKAGGCGYCEVKLLEGEADHRDIFFSEEEKKERGCILTCVSRAKSAQLVLEL